MTEKENSQQVDIQEKAEYMMNLETKLERG